MLTYKVDEGYEYYFDNWYVQMGLVCMTPLRIAMLASAYFIGYCLGGSLFWLPDKIGRKKSVIFSMTLSMLAETVMIFASGYLTRMSCFFFMGLFQLQNSASYLWLYESVAKHKKSTVITIINAVYALSQPVMCLYVLFISKDWFKLVFWALILGYISLTLCFICPESPTWLIVHGHREQCIKVLNQIAKYNGKSSQSIPDDAQFDEDPATRRQEQQTRS